MIVTAALSWFDEPEDLLGECVRGLAGVADRIVAVDGVYRRFPHDAVVSPPSQAAAIRAAAEASGIDCLVVTPDRAWAGQVEKRSALLALAAVGSDWIEVVDADHIVRANAPADVRNELASLDPDADVVSVPMLTPINRERPMNASASTNWHREMAARSVDVAHFFRALPGIHAERFHWWYKAQKGSSAVYLWYGEGAPADGDLMAPRRMRAHFEVEHRCLQRDERHVLANRAFCNDRVMVVERTGQEDDVPGLPAPVFDYATIPY